MTLVTSRPIASSGTLTFLPVDLPAKVLGALGRGGRSGAVRSRTVGLAVGEQGSHDSYSVSIAWISPTATWTVLVRSIGSRLTEADAVGPRDLQGHGC